jgi:hypothetical protein
MSEEHFVDEALHILAAMKVTPAQRNERSALTLLALIDLPLMAHGRRRGRR